MSKVRAILNEGPKVVKDKIRVVVARGKVKVIPAIFRGLKPQIEVVNSKKQLDVSVERFSYEWNQRKPEPDTYRKELERGFEFQR